MKASLRCGGRRNLGWNIAYEKSFFFSFPLSFLKDNTWWERKLCAGEEETGRSKGDTKDIFFSSLPRLEIVFGKKEENLFSGPPLMRPLSIFSILSVQNCRALPSLLNLILMRFGDTPRIANPISSYGAKKETGINFGAPSLQIFSFLVPGSAKTSFQSALLLNTPLLSYHNSCFFSSPFTINKKGEIKWILKDTAPAPSSP